MVTKEFPLFRCTDSKTPSLIEEQALLKSEIALALLKYKASKNKKKK